MKRARSRLGLVPFLGLTVAAASAGGRASRSGRGLWYRLLRKPRWTPPAWVFGPVWTALYTLMSISAYRVWRQPPSPARRRALAIWGLQLGLNGVWSPLFFGRRRVRAAFVDLLGLAASIAAYIRAASAVDRTASVLMAPYLAWVSFAGLLNGSILRRNPRHA